MGPWDIGGLFKPMAVLVLIAMAIIFFIGVQPPNGNALWITLAFLALTAIIWFALERRRFKGPPTGEMITQRKREIEAAERALGQ